MCVAFFPLRFTTKVRSFRISSQLCAADRLKRENPQVVVYDSFEQILADGDKPYITTMLSMEEKRKGWYLTFEQIELPNDYHSLPESIQKYTVNPEEFDPQNPSASLKVGHGSHPHLVHEFVMSILEERKSRIDEVLGANITAAGICAHTSAMSNGEAVIVPEF